MKLDIVRTWEDGSYPQSGEIELSDAQLQSIYGGDGYGGPGPAGGLGGGGPIGGGPLGGSFPFGGGGFGVGVAHTGAFASSERIHSFSVLCDINIFSVNLSLLNIVAIATSTNQTCFNAD